jgi:hypothetical protein
MQCIRAGFIANIAQKSFSIGMSSPNYSSCVEEYIYPRDSAVLCKVSIDFYIESIDCFVTSPMCGIYIHKTTSSSEMYIHYWLGQTYRLLVGDVQVDRSAQGVCFVSYSLYIVIPLYTSAGV